MGMIDGLTMEAVRDGVQVLLCAVVLACVVCGRSKRLRRDVEHPAPLAGFPDAVRLETLRQAADRALAAIQAAVQSERLRLGALIPVAADGPDACAPEAEPADLTPFRLGEAGLAAGAAVGVRYDDLPRLAAGGLTSRDLAVQTRLPAGEIELALKLRRINGGSAHPG
jgi:hypothetical protein